MSRYRKKPVVIEAVQWTGANEADVRALGGDPHYELADGRMLIRTLEGTMEAAVGDWIVRGVKNELYPVKPDIFLATYEVVE